MSNRGTDPQTRLSDDLCGYKNVLCIEYEELLYNNEDELRAMVDSLTNKFRTRFEYYFGTNSDWLAPETELNAVQRLEAMSMVVTEMANEPAGKVDLKFGVHGGLGEPEEDGAKSMPLDRRRLSIALPNGGCEITWPKPPKRGIQTAYAASYPGMSHDIALY